MEIEELLTLSVKHHASDLHLIPGNVPLLRINGTLTPIKDQPELSPVAVKQIIYSMMSKEQQLAFEKDLHLELALSVPDIGNFRVSVLHQLHGIAAVLRIIPESVPPFEELLLPPVVKSLLSLTQGIILITGPTGSGKTTTLAAMLDYINTYRACNIITIEDPIEYTHVNKKSIFHQIQVGRDTPNFSTALRASLRQDPNVVMLGELRDLETMRLALIAAETGQLVLASLHSYSASIAINRFADVFPTDEKNRVRNLLAETLQAVLFQTLVRRTSGGRAAAFEIMLATAPIRHFIRQDMSAHIESTMQTSGDKGMCTLDQYLQQMVAKRIINTKIATHTLQKRGSFKESNPDADGKTRKK